MTPKKDPRSTPKRPKIDIKIDLNFDADLMGRRVEVVGIDLNWALKFGAGTPWEPLGGAPGAQGRRPRHHETALPGTHVRVLNIKIIET